jgi:hypothetical protein
MPLIHIAICGSPGVGKSTMLDRYAHAAHVRADDEVHAGHTVRHLALPTYGLCLHTAPDMMAAPAQLLPRVLAGVQLLVYVVTPEAQRLDEYVADLQTFRDIAAPLDCDWRQLPWLLCLNRMDQGQDFRILEHFPRATRSHCTCTCARRGDGLDTLFAALLSPTAA